MEVTRHNFAETLPLVQDALAECKFFAFDCEMTGLFVNSSNNNNGNNKPPSYLDDIEDRYEELLQSSNAFTINQFGLSAFIWDESTSRWSAKTFNFYTFPHPFEDWEPRFLSEAGSLQFLASCHFDFNKWIYDGIPYMPASLRNLKLKKLDEKNSKESRPDIVLTKQADKEFVENLIKRVKSWLSYGKDDDGNEYNGGNGIDDGDSIYSGSEGEDDDDAEMPKSTEEYLQLEPVNSFQRALQYQTLRNNENFGATDPPGFYIERVEDSSTGRVALKLIRATSAQVAAYELEQQQKRIDEINKAASFCQILEFMAKSQKPAVGHNLSFDIAYTLHSFAKPLPPTWMEFKDRVKKWFPGGIYDTKYIAEQFPDFYPETSLGEIFRATSLESMRDTVALPEIGHASGFERYVNACITTAQDQEESMKKSFSHEAGYDAYMTGAVFAKFLSTLYEADIKQTYDQDGVRAVDDMPAQLPPQFLNVDNRSSIVPLYSFEAVEEYCWRMNVSRSDMGYAVLWGPDNIPSRTNILYITQIDPTRYRHGGEIHRKLSEVKDLVGGGYIRVSVLGMHGTSALLELPRDLINNAAEAEAEGEDGNCEGDVELLKKIGVAVEKALPGCCVKDFNAYRTVKAMQRAGMDSDEDQGTAEELGGQGEDVVSVPAKRPRTAETVAGVSRSRSVQEEERQMALQAAAENTRCSIM